MIHLHRYPYLATCTNPPTYGRDDGFWAVHSYQAGWAACIIFIFIYYYFEAAQWSALSPHSTWMKWGISLWVFQLPRRSKGLRWTDDDMINRLTVLSHLWNRCTLPLLSSVHLKQTHTQRRRGPHRTVCFWVLGHTDSPRCDFHYKAMSFFSVMLPQGLKITTFS